MGRSTLYALCSPPSSTYRRRVYNERTCGGRPGTTATLTATRRPLEEHEEGANPHIFNKHSRRGRGNTTQCRHHRQRTRSSIASRCPRLRCRPTRRSSGRRLQSACSAAAARQHTDAGQVSPRLRRISGLRRSHAPHGGEKSAWRRWRC